MGNYRKKGHITFNNDSVKHFIFMLAHMETRMFALDPAWQFDEVEDVVRRIKDKIR